MLTAAVLVSSVFMTSCGGEKPSESGGEASTGGSTSAGDSASADSDAGEDSNFNELGTFPIVKEKEELIVMTYPNGSVVDMDAYWMTPWYEEKTNVHVNWIVAPVEQFKEKLQISFASEDEIDYVTSSGMGGIPNSEADIARFASQGFIIPLNDIIEKNNPNMLALLDEHEGFRERITTPDGNIYTFAALNECYHCFAANKMYFNKTFCDNLGLDLPTTTEEFRDVLKQIMENDANQNGEADEIGIVGASSGATRMVSTFLMNAFAYDDGTNRLYLDNGKVTASFVSDEWRDGLRYLKSLYDDGLIYKETFTQDAAAAAMVNSQKYENVVAALPNMHYGTVGTRAAGEPVRNIDYVAIAPLKGPDGVQQTYWNYYSGMGMSGYIPSTSTKADLVARWVDWFMSEEGNMTLMNGIEGVGWEQPDEGATGVDGSPATYKLIVREEGDEYYGSVTWNQKFPHNNTAAARLGQQSPSDIFAPDGTGAEAAYYTFTRDNYAPYAMPQDMILPPLFYSEEQISSIAQYQTNINTYVDEAIARFIVGELDIENDWEKYLSEINNMDLEGYLAVVQEAYDSSSYKQ